MRMEETIQYFELPESTVLRINSEAICHLGGVLSEAFQYEDTIYKNTLLDMIQKHSDIILETSDKIVMKQKLNIKAVS
tara:strand:- start:2772 stop:3005 length:234 start_codon:yes stop_codon:yes gene_type:complete